MSEHNNPMFDDMDDVELITSYLNGQLDPDRAAAVRRRLEEDAEFLEFASPFLLVWSVPPHIERHPRPEGELERHWEEFVRRTGFGKRERPMRKPRPWLFKLLQVLILGLAVVVYVWLEPIGAYIESRKYGAPVRYDTAWVAIGDGVQVRLTPGASLRLMPKPYFGRQMVLLKGTARFLVEARDSADKLVAPGRFRVRTRVGYVTAAEAEFSVSTQTDTTIVTVHPFNPLGAQRLKESRVEITTKTGPNSASMHLRARERGLMVRDSMPERIPYSL